MKSNWPTKKLNEVVEIIVGKTPARNDYLNGGIFKVLKYRDINNNKINWGNNEKGFVKESRLNGLKEVREGDVLITSAGHTPDKIGEDAAIVKVIPNKFKKVFFASELICYRPRKDLLLPEWLLFFLNSKVGQEQIKKIVGDSVHLTGTKSKNLQIPLPPLSEQKRIVKKIEKLFAKIDEAEKLRKEAIEDTENLLKSAMQEVFERGEKEGWPTKKLGEICSFQNGLWKGKKPPFRVVKVLRNTNFLNSGYLDLTNVAEIKVEERQLTSRLLQKGDLILERSGGGPTQPVGRVVYFDTDGEYSFSNFTTRIRVNEQKQINPVYLWRYLNYLYISGQTEKLQKQTTGIRNLIFSEYKSLQIPLPPLSEQKQIVAYLDSLSSKIRQLKELQEQTALKLSHLRQSILDRAFKGELRK